MNNLIQIRMLFCLCILISVANLAAGNILQVPPTLPSLQINTTSDIDDHQQKICPIWEAYCIGKKEFEDGAVYEGEFRFGKPSGKGKMTWADGSVYKGEFEEGQPHGWGEYIYADGSFYEGEWVKGFKEGQGSFTWECGHEYIGAFKGDVMDGEGSILMANGESYSGSWKNGVVDGLGTYNRLDGSQFVGMSKNGEKNGQGLIIWETGDTLKGNWSAGKLDGHVNYVFSNGDRMITNWDDGVLIQEMAYYTPDGKVFPGELAVIESGYTLSAFEKTPEFEENISLGLYSFGMEFKSINRFEEATAYLQQSQEFLPESARFNEVIALQLADVKEKQHNSGWANLNNKKLSTQQ